MIRSLADRARLEAEQRALVARVLASSVGSDRPLLDRRTVADPDPRQLRGIPAISRGGLGGAIIGTRPDRAVR